MRSDMSVCPSYLRRSTERRLGLIPTKTAAALSSVSVVSSYTTSRLYAPDRA
jgi:hypothetical protein